jgi:hypothetical protein
MMAHKSCDNEAEYEQEGGLQQKGKSDLPQRGEGRRSMQQRWGLKNRLAEYHFFFSLISSRKRLHLFG